MTGSALNLALKLVVLNVELESVKRGVLRDALVEVLGTRIFLHWIGLKLDRPFIMWITTLFVHSIQQLKNEL